jgi:hypothetical protein
VIYRKQAQPAKGFFVCWFDPATHERGVARETDGIHREGVLCGPYDEWTEAHEVASYFIEDEDGMEYYVGDENAVEYVPDIADAQEVIQTLLQMGDMSWSEAAVIKRVIDDYRKEIFNLAYRLIEGSVQALECGDLSSPNCWIYTNEHWEFDREKGVAALELIGEDPDQIIQELIDEYSNSDEDEDDEE